MTRSTQYLYIREAFPVRINGLGTGKTVTAKFCEIQEGDPVEIGSLTMTLPEDGATGDYADAFARSALLADLAGKIKHRVYLHLDDGVVWHDVWPFVVTDTDPDLLPPLMP